MLVFPANVPLSFKMTSDTVMTSFFIPQLGSQIYAMAGMQTRLHLLADESGTYTGQNQQFSGEWYAEMNFEASAVSPEQFETWLQDIKKSPQNSTRPNTKNSKNLSQGYPVSSFSSVKPGLFNYIMGKYNASMDHHQKPRFHAHENHWLKDTEMFGKLTLEAIPYEDPIVMGAVVGSILLGLAILALITYYRRWKYLWTEWLTSLDHKRIGICIWFWHWLCFCGAFPTPS